MRSGGQHTALALAALDEVVDKLASSTIPRVPGTAIYLFSLAGYAPPALLSNLRLQGAVHERVIILSIETADIPKVQPTYRLSREEIGEGIEQARLRFGFMDDPNVPAELQFALDDPDAAIYIIGSEAITVTSEEGMAEWREQEGRRRA